MNLSQIKQTMSKYNIRPLPQLGQHFLIDERIKELFLKFADINKDDIIVEVGPGLGALTFKIAEVARQVLAVEKDRKLATILKTKAPKNTTIIHGDILKINLKKYLPKRYKLISDVPYNISSPLLDLFLTKASVKPTLMVVMFQKEFADKIIAKNSKMSGLSVFVQSYCKVKKITDVSPSSFWPPPAIKSSLILFILRKKPLLEQKTLQIIKKCFEHRRKKLLSTLKRIFGDKSLKAANIFKDKQININSRPEDLTIKNWQAIEKFLNSLRT